MDLFVATRFVRENEPTWIVFDLIGVLAEPSWREIHDPPSLEEWNELKVGGIAESKFWSESHAREYRCRLRFKRGILGLLSYLRLVGYHICVATNFITSWLDCLEAKATDSLFDARIVSAEFGVAKPDNAFWMHVLNMVPRGSILFDDKWENCIAANLSGLQAIHARQGEEVTTFILSALRDHTVRGHKREFKRLTII